MSANSMNINDSGLQAFTALTGGFDAVELTIKGDVLSRSSTAYVSQGVGTDTHALISDSAETSGLNYSSVSAGSSVTFLGSQSASGSTSIDFTTEFNDTTYLYYLITYTNVRPATNGVDLRVRFSIDGGSSYVSSDYHWVRERLSSDSGGDSIAESDSDSKIKIVVDLGNGSGEGISGKLIYIPSALPSNANPGVLMHDNNLVKDTGVFYRTFGGGMLETNSVINGLRFYMSSGNVAVGDFHMYGISKT